MFKIKKFKYEIDRHRLKKNRLQKKGEGKSKIKLPVNISISDFNIFSSKLRDKFPKNNVAADFPTKKGEGVKKKKNEIEYDNEYKIINVISFHFICFALIGFNSIQFKSYQVKSDKIESNQIKSALFK